MDQELQMFCQNLRNYRKATGLTQKQLAQALHISLYSLRKMESSQWSENQGSLVFLFASRLLHCPICRVFSPIEFQGVFRIL